MVDRVGVGCMEGGLVGVLKEWVRFGEKEG